jgi:hypothetical protein
MEGQYNNQQQGQQPMVMATPIAYAPPQGQYPGYSGAPPQQPVYYQNGQPMMQQPVYGGGQPHYLPPQQVGSGSGGANTTAGSPQQYTQAMPSPQQQQPQVVYVHQRPATIVYNGGGYYSYGTRARYVYWGNPYVRFITLLLVAMVIIGIILEATSSTKCPSGCTDTTCLALYV